MNEKDIQELQFLLTDIIQGDTDLLSRPEFQYFTTDTIQTALNFLMNNKKLSNIDKAYLISNSWKVNYRAKPPSPEEFITEKYIGRSAIHTYERVKDNFVKFLDPSKPYRDLILYPFVGFGKELRNDCKIKTPEGNKEIGKMRIGDLVCAPDGTTTKVTAVFPQGKKDIYKITFADNRVTFAGLEHQWKVAKSFNGRKWDSFAKKYINLKIQKPCWKTVTTKYLIENKDSNWFIPLPRATFHSEKTHIIPPYSFGALLGDGYFGKTLSICGNDKEVHNRITNESKVDVTTRKSKSCKYVSTFTFNFKPGNPYTKELSKYNLREARSHNKFIPDDYLYDSIENRIALLQGLMDTDGTANLKGNNRVHCSYFTSSPLLRDNFITLIRGLGGVARFFTDKVNKRLTANYDNFKIYFTFPNNDFDIFSIKRKQDRVNKDFNSPRRQRKPQYLHIKNIELVGRDEATCITVEHPDHLFIADDYIVTHNSYMTTLITLYIGTHLALMRNPYKFFGLNPASIITQLLISYSLKKSSELLLEPMIAILESSPFFEKVHKREKMLRLDRDFARSENVNKIFWTTAVPTSAIQMSNGANVKLASSVHSLLGLTIVSGALSELAFFTEAGKSPEYIMRVFNDLKGRVESRMRGNYFGRTILDSSPNTLDSPIDDYIVNYAHKDPKNFIVQGSRWEWALPGEFDMTKVFHINKGGRGQPPYIINTSQELERIQTSSPDRIVEVPLQLKQLFVDDIYKALKDQAGIPSGSPDNLIYDYSKIERIFQYPLKNVYTHIKASIKEKPENLIWNQIQPLFFNKVAGKYEFYYKPWIPRVLAVDQSLVNDVSAIVMMHVEKIRDSENSIFVTDLTIPVAPQGDRISLDAIKFFIEDLRNKGNLVLTHISFDQFQSEASIQYLNKKGFQVEKLSVDNTTDPYIHMLSLIETGRFYAGKNLHLKNNLKSIKFVKHKRSKKVKVDHDASKPVIVEGDQKWESSLIGSYAKDVTDGCAACCELLRIFHPYAVDLWDPEIIIKMESPENIKRTATNNINAIMKEMNLKV